MKVQLQMTGVERVTVFPAGGPSFTIMGHLRLIRSFVLLNKNQQNPKFIIKEMWYA